MREDATEVQRDNVCGVTDTRTADVYYLMNTTESLELLFFGFELIVQT